MMNINRKKRIFEGMTTRKIKNFTLIEIVICMAILALASGAIAWPIRNMIATHRFNKSISNFASDLKKSQILALSNQTDLELKIFKKNDQFYYHLSSEDPIPLFLSKPMKLTGVNQLKKDQKSVDQLLVHIYSSGRMDPIILQLLQDEQHGMEFDLHTPHLIGLKKVEGIVTYSKQKTSKCLFATILRPLHN
jgi:prepilin-type N-terminal cleavage/methylation domain-containing protein